MADLESLKRLAEEKAAHVQCPECGHDEPMVEYLDRDGRVDEDESIITTECPGCGNDTLSVGQRRPNGTIHIVVEGLEQLEKMAGE